ncbi:MAG TPA: hypothetical protein VNA89_04825 [Gemmatimonadaceae bacterium]|nr:hypothetical protein [Gemmatimonadaceae bacterium]
MRRLLARLQQTVAVSVTRERVGFASARREVTIDAAVRVAPDGRILGFGARGAAGGAQVMPLFPPGASDVDERALVALCRRGLALALGPWGLLRPRVVVRGAERVQLSAATLARALRAAGAATVELVD